jgi:hypothetical protein
VLDADGGLVAVARYDLRARLLRPVKVLRDNA